MDVYAKKNFANRQTVIFGAGYVGKYIMDICRRSEINVVSFCDNRIYGTFIDGIPVYKLTEIKEAYPNSIFIIAIRDIEFIIKQLSENGFKDWLPITSFYNIDEVNFSLDQNYRLLEIYWYRQKYFLENNPNFYGSIDFMITEKCSLKCRDCSNLMQYYKNPSNFSLEILKEEVDFLLNIVEEIFELRIIGGEPLMNPIIYELIDYIKQYDKVKKIVIYTNGTIPLDKEKIKKMKNRKVWFSISDYKKLSYNIKTLIRQLEDNQIGYERKNIEYWTSCSSLKKQNRNNIELENIFKNCCSRHIFTYLKGKLYSCPFIGNAINLKAIPLFEDDYVDITKGIATNQIQDEIKKKLNERLFFNSCNYCLGRPILIKEDEKIMPNIQIDKAVIYEKCF